MHHVAFSTDSDETQRQIREKLVDAGMQVTQVLDRQYFHSIYFREPGGVLFEVATNPPGFIKDEEVADLGTALKLPPWEEKNRKSIEQNLIPIR
ncbi:MAG: VOC family protein [Cyclobacteriaceae bacterium]